MEMCLWNKATKPAICILTVFLPCNRQQLNYYYYYYYYYKICIAQKFKHARVGGAGLILLLEWETLLPKYIFQSLGVATCMRRKCLWYQFVYLVVAMRTARIWRHSLSIFYIMANNYGELRLAELRGELRKRNAKVSGRKAELVQR